MMCRGGDAAAPSTVARRCCGDAPSAVVVNEKGPPFCTSVRGVAGSDAYSIAHFPEFCREIEKRAFDRAFAHFLQKARSRTHAWHHFRPCLCAFLLKGTVAHLHFTHFSTVPLALFCKRHGRAPPLHALFDRAFARFSQKARSHTSASRTFRPCLCAFLSKGTVAHLHFTHFSTVPLPVFRKRHGRTPPLHALFDRAFARFSQKARSHATASRTFRPCLCLFYQKARSHTSTSRTFRPCLCLFFAKGTVARHRFTHFSTVPLPFFGKRHGCPPSSFHLSSLRQSCCSKNDKKWRDRAVLRCLSTWFLSGRRLTLCLLFERA